MAKALKTIGVIAGAVALVATGVGAIGGAALAAKVGTTIGVSLATVSKIATVVAIGAQLGSQALTKPPSARGSVNQRIIGANQPTPYLMGRSYSGGGEALDVGYGGKVDDVQNPYRFMSVIYSLGPIQGYESYLADFVPLAFSGNAATGYYNGFLYRGAQIGAQPEASALAPQWGTAPGWGASSKLSGKAAVGWSAKFDKKGKVFASGLPQLGVIANGVSVYDPRLDSTYPGGSGPQRIDDETTWTYSERPALHALTYAIGRYQNGLKVFGVDLGGAAIDIPAFVAWANVCDANDWKVGGTIYEPGDKWQNLKLICQAGSATPFFSGGLLTVRWDAPAVAVDTIDINDLADGEISVGLWRPWKERKNTALPKYRSEEHQWEYVQIANAIVDDDALAADGEERVEERELTLVQDKDQAATLGVYLQRNSREASPIVLPLKPRFLEYRAGQALAMTDRLKAALGLDQPGLDCAAYPIRTRQLDPETAVINVVLETDTPGKHTAALAAGGIAPPATTPPTGIDLDNVIANASAGAAHQIIAASATVAYPVTTTENSIVIEAFDATIDDGRRLSFPADTITGLVDSTAYVVLWDMVAGDYVAALSPAAAELADSDNVIIRYVATAQSGGGYPTPDPPPGGDYGGGYNNSPYN